MGFLKRIASILGFLHGADDDDGGEDRAAGEGGEPPRGAPSGRKGFSVQVPVAVPKHQAVGPVLVPCKPGEGGVQGLKWYVEQLRVDEDGDAADEFLDEVSSEGAPRLDDHRTKPTFKVKYRSQPAIVRNQIIVADGSVRHSVEHKGRVTWV